MGLWVDRRECFVLFGHGCLGFAVLELAVSGHRWYGANQRAIKETESERTMGRERD